MLESNLNWKRYLHYGDKRFYDENTIVFNQGEVGEGFYYLDDGMVINKFLSITGEERYINHISTGMLFGEEGSNGNPFLYTAITTAPSTIYFFSQQVFMELCKTHPEAGITFINFQIYNFRKRIELIKLLDSNIETQMIFYLSQFVNESLDIPFNQTSIANDLVTSRVTINKIIRKWKEKGLIKLSRQKIQILDRDKFFGLINYTNS